MPSSSTNTQWKKDWSVTSNKWKTLSETNRKLLLSAEQMNEFFYISFEDYCKNFQIVHFVHVDYNAYTDSNEAKHNTKWVSKDFDGAWIKEVNAGGKLTSGIEK